MLQQDQHIVTPNREIDLPPIALIPADNETAWSCDHFFLPATKITGNKSLSIMTNAQMNTVESEIINLHETITNDTHWEKIPYIPTNMRNILDFITRTQSMPISNSKTRGNQDWTTSFLIVLTVATSTLILMYGYLIWNGRHRNQTKMIMVPSI